MSDQVQGLDLEIKQLERDKKIEEIRQLKANSRTKWITPALLLALLPLLAAFGAWTVNEMKQYNEGYRALAEKGRLVAEAAELQRQKTSLNQEIVALLALKTHYVDEFKGLEEKVKARQAQLDGAFLRARFSSGEAAYALGHVDAFKPDEKKMLALAAQAEKLPPDVSAPIAELTDSYKFALEMVDVTKKTLKHVNDALNLIPASDWTAKLTMSPTGAFAKGRKIMGSNDGSKKLYDVDEGRFLTREEVLKLRPTW